MRDLSSLLFDTSLLTSGSALDEPTSKRIHRMISLGLDVDDLEPTSESVEDRKNTAVEEVASTSAMEEIDWTPG